VAAAANVRFGSKGDIGRRPDDVCFTPGTDIEDRVCDVRFVPILLQKSVETGREA
jgi:hypothetical protein